jgi:hypothetical protein
MLSLLLLTSFLRNPLIDVWEVRILPSNSLANCFPTFCSRNASGKMVQIILAKMPDILYTIRKVTFLPNHLLRLSH